MSYPSWLWEVCPGTGIPALLPDSEPPRKSGVTRHGTCTVCGRRLACKRDNAKIIRHKFLRPDQARYRMYA